MSSSSSVAEAERRILLIEDDVRLARLIQEYLQQQTMEVSIEHRGDLACQRIVSEMPDLVVLDLMLPGLDGLEVCRAVRPQYQGLILMLTARDEDIDQVVGLEIGADDYVTKPVQPRVLLARIRALLRRFPKPVLPPPVQQENDVYEIHHGCFRISVSAREAWLDGHMLDLTTTDFDLLWLLASHAGTVLTRDTILGQLRGILPPAKIKRLNDGEMVVAELYGASHSYQRIAGSEWVLEFPFEQSEYQSNQRLSNSTFNLIEMQLQAQPAEMWPEALANLQGQFNFPIHLLQQDQLDLPAPLQKDLLNGKIAWQDIDGSTDYLFRRIADGPHVLKLGPFGPPLTLRYLEPILMGSLALLVALAVLFWVYPLWRDLKCLSASAELFGQGDFSARAPLPKRSVLHHLAKGFNSMASRIQRLISSHKELTNAVSHELRTPIARLRFGMEMLQSSSNETDRSRYIQSMNADIDELDQLVAELLTYARFDRDRPALAFQRQKVAPWLNEIVRQVMTGNDGVRIDDDIDLKGAAYAYFEPKLMARALVNLLQNGQRYAQSRVHVTFATDQQGYRIMVDDDGAGIPEQERASVFEAFKRLDASRDRGTGGYGLGLAIVQRISQWHGGDVMVEDSPLGGARLTILWPENAPSNSA